ncbi:holin [Kitasatospora sp. NPDC050543]|uniref:holin n=1 Tax=Kitasatospora sp. NPDC050543 TaxID=3364054 RepID=UPI0037A8076E
MPKLFVDLAERTVATYVVAFLGLLLADGVDLTSVGTLRAAVVAALPAALTVIKGGISSFVGAPNSAALLPRQRV